MINRQELARALIDSLTDQLVVTGIGNACNDMYAAGDRALNFYMRGSMGAGVPIAFGLARARPNDRVICVEGDGSVLMNMGALATIGSYKPDNLTIVVLDNGAYLGGKNGALLMQNSGLGNAANILASLTVPYQIPMLLIISQRGELGEFNTVQVGMGQALRPTLDGVDVQHFTMEREDEVEKIMTGAIKLAFSTDRPVAVIVSPLLSGGKSL